jgi:tRNA uridine 5-carbamoylmethylation protein Kti12
MQEQFRAVQKAREEKRKQEEDKLTEKIRERIKQLNEMHTIVSGIVSEIPIEMPIETDISLISIQMQVEEVAFTTCRICEFPVVWGTSPPTNCVFCCANMKFY